jgi:cobalamin biosynthesis protein CbiD
VSVADDVPYWIRRSYDEAILSIQAGDPAVAEAHAEMCRLYTRQVQDELRARQVTVTVPGGRGD